MSPTAIGHPLPSATVSARRSSASSKMSRARPVDPAAAAATFLELGFNSLLLSQVAQRLQTRLKVKIAFRQLLGELSTIVALASFIQERDPSAAIVPARATCPAPSPRRRRARRAGAGHSDCAAAGGSRRCRGAAGVEALMRAQVEAMSQLIKQQLDTLKRIGLSADAIAGRVAPGTASPAAPVAIGAAAPTERTPPISVSSAYRPAPEARRPALTPEPDSAISTN